MEWWGVKEGFLCWIIIRPKLAVSKQQHLVAQVRPIAEKTFPEEGINKQG